MKTRTPFLFRFLNWLAILALAVVGFCLGWKHFKPTYRLSMTTQYEVGEIMRVWVSDNSKFENSEAIKLWCPGGEPQHHSIPLGDTRIRYVKIIPPYNAGLFRVSDVKLHCDVLKQSLQLDLNDFEQIHIDQARETAAGEFEITYQDRPGHAVLRLGLDEFFPAKRKAADHVFFISLALGLPLLLMLVWYVSRSAPIVLPVAAGAMIVAMAVESEFNIHPDEWSHLSAAAYYFEHNWFPLVDSPELEPFTIPTVGISYAQLNDLTYPLAGKFIRYSTPGYTAAFFEKLPSTDLGGVEGWGWKRARVFHCGAFLFLIALVFLALRRGHGSSVVLVAMLVFTPQLWYVFSYYNGDAFGFFLSALPAILIVSQQDKLFCWFDSQRGKMARNFLRLPLFWLLMLAIFFVYFAKKNYLICLPFYCLLLGLMAFERYGFRWRFIVRALSPALLGVCAILLFAGYEHYRHDFNRETRILDYWNSHGEEEFQPKNFDKPFFDKGLMMRTQGVGLGQMLKDGTWWSMILRSSVGCYGGMNVWAVPLVYWLYAGLSLAFLFSWFWLVNGRRRRLLPLLLGLMFCLAALAQAMSYSWLIAYEPQGRYLLPILPIMATALGISLRHGAIPLAQSFVAPFFALSCYSFALVALPALAGF